MALTIHRTPEPTRLIRLGHGAKTIEPEPIAMAAAMPIPEKDLKHCDLCNAEFHADRVDPLCMDCRAGMELAKVTTPPEPEKNKRGRPKTMAKEDLDKAGVKTIREDDPGEQGAIGSHGANAPAQEKVPDKSQESDQNKEE